MRGPVILAAILIAGSMGSIVAGAEPQTPSGQKLREYRLALIREQHDVRAAGEREIQALQEGHLSWLRDLYARKILILSGPVDGGGDLRDVLVLDLDQDGPAQDALARDPWIASGRRRVELHPWLSLPLSMRPPSDIARITAVTLGLLQRPEGAPSYPEEKLQEIQRGHLAHLGEMAASGDLAAAGPMGDDTRLRGILIFRGSDVERLAKMASGDPAVQAGRLEITLLPWHVPAGVVSAAAAP